MVKESPLGEELSTWLQSYPWDYFFTITNRRPRRDAIAFMRDIERTTGDDCYARMFIACEPHKFNHNLHAHGILSLSEPASLPWRGANYRPTTGEFWDEWYHRFGRTRVEPVLSRADVTNYCVKYVTKLTGGDNYDYYGGQLDWC